MSHRWAARCRRFTLGLAVALGTGTGASAQPQAKPGAGHETARAALHLRIVGGLADVHQYTRHEEPFWRREVPRLTAGRVSADITPHDRAGLRGQDMLRLMKLGVVPFGTALLGLVSSAEPVLAAPDMAGLNPDMPTLRAHIQHLRPLIESTLRDVHGIELLALYTYPAQVLFCREAFGGLADLAGRRIRVSSVSQADFFEALGARPAVIAFADVEPALRRKAVDCAVTGTMSGHTIGLPAVARFVHTLPINWGVAVFGANQAAWGKLPPDVQTLLRRELAGLEQAIWVESESETGEGIRCNAAGPCAAGAPGQMTVVRASAADEAQRLRVMRETEVPRWKQRCGPPCEGPWGKALEPLVDGTRR